MLLRQRGRETGSSLQPTKIDTADSCRDSPAGTQGQRDTQLPASHRRIGLQAAAECRDNAVDTQGQRDRQNRQPTEEGLQAAAEAVLLRLWGRATGSSLQPTRTGAADSCRDSAADTQGQRDTQLPAAHKTRAAGSCRDSVAEAKGQGDRQQPATHKDRGCRQLQRQRC